MKLETAIRRQTEAITRLEDHYGSAKHFHLTSQAIHTKALDIIAAAKLPRVHASLLQGYNHCLSRKLVQEHIVHGKWHDGKFYSTDRRRDDYAERYGITWREYGELPAEAQMYWADRPERPFYVHVP